MIHILQEYEKASGQKVNIEKSSITFSIKTPQEVKDTAKSILGIQKEGGVGKYLGLPEHFGRRKKDLFTSIVDRIRQRASNWSTRFLSRAGKLTMLKAVLTSIPTYAMSCFQLPTSLCKRIQSTLTRFWWDKSADKKGMCWVAWDKLTLPKTAGGLGLRDIQLFNQALLAKIAWRILTNPSCLLARVLKGKYCHKRSFLDAQTPSACSHGWRSVLHGRDLLSDNLGKAIGNGQDTRVWKDSWISLSHQLKPYGPIPEAALDLRVSDLLTDDLKWNKSRINEFLPEFSAHIQCLRPSTTGAEDAFIWLPLQSGTYSTKSGYNTRALTTTPAVVPPPSSASPTNTGFAWIKDVWSLHTSPKLRVFLWSIIQGALPVGVELQRRGMLAAAPCPRCNEPETSMHIFFHCPYAKEVWNLLPLQSSVHIADDLDFKAVLSQFRRAVCLPPTGIRAPIIPWVCWGLWTARNRFIFEKKTIQPLETVSRVLSSALEWDQSQAPPPLKTTAAAQRSISQRPPLAPSPMPRCFVDAAWDASSNTSGVAWKITSTEAHQNLSGSEIFENIDSPLVAEALALYHGIRKALDLGLPSISFFSDCKTLTRAIITKSQIKEIYGILMDIDSLSSHFVSISFHHIPRSQNRDADLLAKMALKAHLLSFSFVG